MGIFDGVAADIEPKEFFLETLPGAFQREMEGLDTSGLEGTVLNVVFNIEGDPFTVTLTNGKELDVKEGAAEKPDIQISMTKERWRQTVSGELGNALDMFTDFKKLADRTRYDAVKDVKGKLNLVIERKDADKFDVIAVFAGEEKPEVTITCDMENWQGIMAGTNQPVSAFMGGKLRVTGEMTLAMKLNTLM